MTPNVPPEAAPGASGPHVRKLTRGGAPLFANGSWWLLRYTMKSGNSWWYIADKDNLDSDDGDMYRVQHNGKLPPHTAKGLETDGKSFVVIATAPIAKGAQVFLSYGPLPNMMLLQQWGFVLPTLGAPDHACQLPSAGCWWIGGIDPAYAADVALLRRMRTRRRSSSPR